MENEVLIYTDGSCDANPNGNGGYSCIIFKNENPIFLSGYEPNTTNQRMEMQAVIAGLSFIKKPSNIKVFTDSAYVANCFIQKWYEKWQKNGWKTSTGSDVLNKDLWRDLIELLKYHTSVTFIKVKGHSDNMFNNKCDEMAKDVVAFKKAVNMAIEKRKNK